MDNEENNIANETEQPKQKIGSKIASNISKANQLRHDYQNAGGLTGMVKNAINDKIHDKIGSKVDAAKEKVKGKVNDKKDALKGKINDKLPDSVKQKKAQMDAKKKAIHDKMNAPKDKLNDMKQKLDEKRKNANVKAFKSAAKEIANTAAPGSGLAVDAMLNSKKGQPAVKEAENASNPASAIAKGGKKLVEITIKEQIKKKVAIYLIPVFACACLILLLIGAILNKYGDNIEFISEKLLPLASTLNFGGSPQGNKNLNDLAKGNSSSSIEMSNPIYNEFYNNIADLGGINKTMVISVLTVYKNNDDYTTKADYTTDIVQNTDSKQMKAYIKMVADAISESNGDISQGDYSKPGESGSSFFKWLYNDFVEQYYAEYFNTLPKDSIPKMKTKLVKAIYDYYELLIKYFPLNESQLSLTAAASCPNGVTVEGAGTYDLEEYIAGVVNAENGYYKGNNIEAMKAQAVASRTFTLYMTDKCTKSIGNSQNTQVFKEASEKSKEATKATEGQVLTYDGNIFLSKYDHYNLSSCSNGWCTASYTKQPKNEKHEVKIPETYADKFGRLGGHGNGMSQVASNYLQDEKNYNYEQILKYFYSNGVEISKLVSTINGGMILGAKGIYSASIFPIQDLKSVTVTHGYYYGGDAKKKYHGALDIACNAHNREACIKIPIYAAHSGVVTDISTDYCANSEYENADTTLKRVYKCGGLGVKIKITDKADPYCDYEFLYWHFEKMANNIKPGVKIETGQFLGNMGSTGSSTGWHLHFQIVNPKGQDLNQNDNIKAFGKATGLKVNNFYPTNALPKY